ncbi:MAG: helix-turn-helix domain-containing protein [Rhizobiales bacterium]|nr:helix-turn-helix domain-containing protein [Hyphomicrobiales bacterium]
MGRPRANVLNLHGVARDETGEDGGADDGVGAFLTAVGERVHACRTRKGLSRRTLSQKSAVSERYLAQLEAGAGNISISLLRRISLALDVPIEWLLAEEDPWLSDTHAILALYRHASPAQRRKVQQILDPALAGDPRARRIAFIGLRGAGKSTIGQLCAARLDAPFHELNAEIELVGGMPVQEIFALYGQEGYRRLERQAIEQIAATHDRVVLAVAGGIVSEPETFDFLLKNFHAIWLRAAPTDHLERVRGQGDERPMAESAAPLAELQDILRSREALYARARAVVETSGRTVERTLADTLDVISALGISGPR